MAGHTCDNCVYSVCDPQAWHRSMWMGESILPRCANHPHWPGQMHEVPGVPCRNYRPKPILPEGDGVRLIPLGDGFYAYVDAADYQWLSRYTWRLENGYAARHEKGKRISMHRQIMEPPADMVVDHIDGNRANDCRFNLRICTHAENRRNQRKRLGSRSRFKGVLYDKQYRKWFAVCRTHFRGYFDDEIGAARAYDHMAVEWIGEFARLNFPEDWPPERRQELYAQRDVAKIEGKKVGGKEGKTTAGRSRKVKGKNRKPHAETRGRRDQRGTTKAKDEPKAAHSKTKGHKVVQ